MLPELEEIKKKRKLFGMTQADLAAECGVSQSLIAKLESGKIVPAYGKAKKIFDTLESMQKHSGLKAREIMSRAVVYAEENEAVSEVIGKMSKNGFSQMPVMKKGANTGTISERALLRAVKEGKDISKLRAKDIMDGAMPSVNDDSPSELISSMLEYAPAVIVKKEGAVEGIITKADLLKAAVRRR